MRAGVTADPLLEKLLSTSKDVIALGEICHFSKYVDDPSKDCSCGVPLPACPFWTEVRSRLDLEGVRRIDDCLPTDGYRSRLPGLNFLYHVALVSPPRILHLLEHRVHSIAAHNRVHAMHHWRVIETVSRLREGRVLVDKSMAASRLLEIKTSAPSDYRLCAIHLVRDGRAVAHSHREQSQLPIAKGARQWRAVNQRVEIALRRSPTMSRLRVRYEDVCADPEGTLRSIAQAFELPMTFDVGRIGDGSHAIGGDNAKLTGYGSIARDQRHVNGLSTSERKTFERIAGRMNRRYGYD